MVLCPWPSSCLSTWPLLASLVGVLPRSGVVGDVHRSTPCRVRRDRASKLSRSLLGRARRSAAWLVNRRASHPRAYGARLIPGADARLRAMSQNLRSQVLRQALRLFPRATVISSANGHRPHPLRGMSRKVRERGAPSAPTAPGSPAQPWSVMLTVVARAMKTPRCSRNLRQAVKQNTFASRPAGSAPTPPAERRDAACSFTVPCPAPAGPRQSCRQRSCHQLCSEPCALAHSMRHTHRVNA